jgi:putative ABC transport system substrate-binding protein
LNYCRRGGLRVGKITALSNIIAVLLLAIALSVEAQPPQRVYRVGLLTLGGDPAHSPFWQKFLNAMRELNYVEGRNLNVTRAFADGNLDRLPGLVADLVRAKVDVIVSTSTRETVAAKQATPGIPIVMTLVPDPVEQGLVASLARPGSNVTGLVSVVPGISQKYVELLHETVPHASRLAVVGGSKSPFPELRQELRVAARKLGITVAFIEITAPDEIDSTLARAKADGAGGVIVALDRFTYWHRSEFVQLALKHRLPTIYWARDYVEDGGLMAYGASFANVGGRAAYFVDKILKGAKPADLPVEQPTQFELVINLKTAKALGLTIPASVLVRADQVIE